MMQIRTRTLSPGQYIFFAFVAFLLARQGCCVKASSNQPKLSPHYFSQVGEKEDTGLVLRPENDVNNRFNFIEELRPKEEMMESAMSSIWRVRHSKYDTDAISGTSDSDVVLKVLPLTLSTEQATLDEWKSILALSDIAGIIPVKDAWVEPATNELVDQLGIGDLMEDNSDSESEESESDFDSYQNLLDFELKTSQLASFGISQLQLKSSMPQMDQCTESGDSIEDESIVEYESSVVSDSNDFKDNIPSVIDHVLFLELPFRQHGTLKSWIADRANPLSPEKLHISTKILLEIFHDLLSITVDIHERNFMHRDLKPANVMIKSLQPFKIEVIDLGLAIELPDAGHQCTSSLGTIQYASPEQVATGQAYDAKTDVYSVGMIMLEVFSPQATGQAKMALRRQLAKYSPKSNPADFDEIRHIPSDIIRLIQWMTESRPNDRASSVAALEALEHILLNLATLQLGEATGVERTPCLPWSPSSRCSELVVNF